MSIFQFKYFSIQQKHSTLKVGTDAMLLGSFIPKNQYQSILDVGTGTGVLALMAMQQNPHAKVLAIDIDLDSQIDAIENFKNSTWDEQIRYELVNYFKLPIDQKFDLIISNPPYYEDGLLSENLAINRVKHASDFDLEEFFHESIQRLSEQGDIMVILPHSATQRWIQFFNQHAYGVKTQVILESKIGKPIRTIFKIGKTIEPLQEITLVIRNEDNSYTDSYKEQTIDFHSKKL